MCSFRGANANRGNGTQRASSDAGRMGGGFGGMGGGFGGFPGF